MRKIKTPVTGVSMFRLLYEMRHLKVNWKIMCDVQTLLEYVFDEPNLFLSYDGELDIIVYDNSKFESVTWVEFKEIIRRDKNEN